MISLSQNIDHNLTIIQYSELMAKVVSTRMEHSTLQDKVNLTLKVVCTLMAI